MKEASSLRQPYATSRDLGVVMEESEGNVAMSQSNMNYINQVLDPSLPSSLSFLRSVHTKNHSTSTSPYHHSELNSNHALENGRAGLPMRRARAGTMPSMIHIPDDRAHRSPIMRPSAAAAVAAATTSTASDTRHRSGSLNLPAPPPMQLSFDSSIFGTSWANMERDNSQSQVRSSLPSPSTEQLLRGDSDFSIARTLRSLGLEDERATSMAADTASTAAAVYHHQHEHPTPDMHVPTTRSLLSSNRSRSYSVNAAARYQEPPISTAAAALHSSRSRASSVSRTFANPLDNLTVHQNRPRAASMGRMDYARSANPPIPSSLWQMQRVPLETLSDEDSEYQSQTYAESTAASLQNEQPSLSLGDSELLANMLQKQQTYAAADGLKVTAETQNHHPMRYVKTGTLPEPYMHYSQSTPTFRSHQAQMTPSTSSPTQAVTRSLWIGNIDATVTVENLTQMFSAFGAIESVRLLLEKECAFVNFFQTEDAVRAKEEVLGRLGGRVGNCIVRIGFGRADAAMPDTTALQPTRALWLGNIPPGTAPSTLQHLFTPFGTIESVRVLSHKNCGFVNFDSVESASRARDALLQNEIGVPGFGGVRVGFAKVPPAKVAADGNSKVHNTNNNDRASFMDTESWLVDLWKCMQAFGAQDEAMSQVKTLETPSSYFESIPPVPELGANRKFDAAKLRELRKKLDGATRGTREVEMIAFDCMDEIAGLSSDYIGNTVVQRLFEKCTEDTKTAMLERIAPHLAAIGVHKNGTWAAQKIIDTIKTPAQVNLVCTHLKPYVPPLLLDQFGNYAVQCCLRLGDGNNQFIFDAMVEKLLNIAQGRFGARAMRGILENQHVTANQQIFVAAALAQNVVSLSVNANGSLLLSWLLDSSNFEDRFSIVASRLAPHLSQVATHKLGSQMVLKIINQTHDNQAQSTMLDGLMEESTLSDILGDQVRGLSLIHKVISCSSIPISQRQAMAAKIQPLVTQSDSAGHKKLLDELSNICNGGNSSNNNDRDEQ